MTDSKDELRQRFDAAREEGDSADTGDAGDGEDCGETGNTDTADDSYDWSDTYNYPFYMPPAFAEELDALYNRYDGKNKIEGGDGLEKHREFLFPLMAAAIKELDLDEVIDWNSDK